MSHFSLLIVRARRAARRFTWGGEWALPLPQAVKRNLTWFFFDGLFAAASDNIIVTYLSLYLLALGATRAQIGLTSSFSSLSAAILLLPAAFLVERVGHRQELTILFGGILGRFMVLLLACLPLMLQGQALIFAGMALAVLRDAFGNLGYPAWMSLTGAVVPLEGRGRYFGARNFAMGVAGITLVYLMGELITRLPVPTGYQLALGLAFFLGLISTYCFWHLRDPEDGVRAREPEATPFSVVTMLKDIWSRPAFLALSLVMGLWNLSLNIAGPFFSVYMVEGLHFSAVMVGAATIVSNIAGLLVQPRVGALSDRWGPRRVQLISMLFIPALPAAWIFITRFWHVVALNIFSGALWGAFNLVSFNLLLTLTPSSRRARYSAFYQMMVTLSLAGGAALGSWIVTVWGYKAVFLCSAIGRFSAALLFARFVPAILPPRRHVDQPA